MTKGIKAIKGVHSVRLAYIQADGFLSRKVTRGKSIDTLVEAEVSEIVNVLRGDDLTDNEAVPVNAIATLRKNKSVRIVEKHGFVKVTGGVFQMHAHFLLYI